MLPWATEVTGASPETCATCSPGSTPDRVRVCQAVTMFRRERGATAVEYGLMVALVTVVVIAIALLVCEHFGLISVSTGALR